MLSRIVRLSAVGMALLPLLGCGAGSVAFREGRKAEVRKDFDTALIQYQKAVQAEPENAQYILRERHARIQASLFHLKRGRSLLAGGRPDDAIGEFQKAASIDPTNEAAAQELSRLLAAQAAAKRAREALLQQALKAREGAAGGGAVQLNPFPPEPMSHVKISGDSRRVYETLAKLAGLNVVFTSDYPQGKNVTLDLTNVKLEDAVRVVGYQTKTFYKAVTSNTILVIPDTPNNRRDYDEEVLKTIYLSNPLAPADRTAITTALKQILGLQRIIDNPDSNAIIIRDTPAKVAAAEKVIRDLDRAKAEILVEVAVVEADRDRIRDLGLSPVTVSPQGSISPGLQTGAAFNPIGTGAGDISYRDYSVALPSAAATALLSDSHTHILQNPQVRVTDGQTAKLRIGSRVPFATGSFLPSFGGSLTGGAGGQTGFGLLASTQFQYQDVGVNLDLTPRLLANGEVSLHATIEISSVGQIFRIGGLDQPSFGQRRIEHDIRLKEGEMNLLGGLIESRVTRTISGLPFLGQVPGLRYLFSTEHNERVETEVLIMLTPWVIRLPELAAEAGKGVTVTGGVPTPPPQVPETSPPPAENPPVPPGQPE